MSETANKENKNIDFESAMKRLDEITNQLSREGVSLDKALALYEEGVNLARLCNDKLDETDRKIKLLQLSQDGEVIQKDFINAENL